MNTLHTALAASVSAVALLAANPALAAHAVVYGPEAYTSSSATTGDSSAAADIRNLVVNPGSNYAQGLATSEALALTANGYTVKTEVITTSLGAPGRTSSAGTLSSLEAGVMRARITQTNPRAFGFPGADTLTQFQDTLFFTNNSGQALSLGLTFSFDGVAQAFEPNTLNGLAALVMSNCGNCGNTLGQSVTFGTGRVSVAAYSVFNEEDVYNVYDQLSGQQLDTLGFTVQNNTNGIGSILQTTVVVPTGETSLGVKAWLTLSARSAASADFGNTATFSLGALPNGLSYSSASGVFLTAPVPEPATWAMVLSGIALLGGLARRSLATQG